MLSFNVSYNYDKNRGTLLFFNNCACTRFAISNSDEVTEYPSIRKTIKIPISLEKPLSNVGGFFV